MLMCAKHADPVGSTVKSIDEGGELTVSDLGVSLENLMSNRIYDLNFIVNAVRRYNNIEDQQIGLP